MTSFLVGLCSGIDSAGSIFILLSVIYTAGPLTSYPGKKRFPREVSAECFESLLTLRGEIAF